MEVDFSGDQEDDRLDRSEAGESTRTAFGGLEQSVDGLQKPIGLARLCPGYDALQVGAYHLGDILHWLDLGAHHAIAPVRRKRVGNTP